MRSLLWMLLLAGCVSAEAADMLSMAAHPGSKAKGPKYTRQGAAAPAGWTPPKNSNLQVWWDASDESSGALTTLTNVGQLGATGDFTQGTSSLRGTVVADCVVAGQSCLRLDGTDDEYDTADNAVFEGSALTIMLVSAHRTITTNEAYITKWTHGSQTDWAWQSDQAATDETLVFHAATNPSGGSNQEWSTNADRASGVFDVLFWVYDGGAAIDQRCDFYNATGRLADARASGCSATMQATSAVVRLGAFSGALDRNSDTDFAEVMIWDVALNASEREAAAAEMVTEYSVAQFDPADDAATDAWYDFSDAATLFSDSSCTTPAVADGNICCITDKGPSGYDLIQATSSKCLQYKTGIQEGHSIGRADGTDDTLTAASVALPNHYVWMALDTSDTSGYVFTHVANSAYVYSAAGCSSRYSADGANSSAVNRSTTMADGAWHVWRHRRASTHANHAIAVDGADDSASDCGAGGLLDPGSGTETGTLFLAASHTGATNLGGDFGEIVFAADSTSKLADHETYQTRWGTY